MTCKEWTLWAVAVAVVVFLWVQDTEARANTCQDWANIVEKLEALDHRTRDAVINNMHKLRDHYRYQTLAKATMWVRAGQTAAQAWRQCESY